MQNENLSTVQQMVELETLLQERRTTYEQQIETLIRRWRCAGRSHLESLAAQEVERRGAVRAQFTQAQGERQAVYSTRRQEAQERYADIRYNQMLGQLAEVQAKLAEARRCSSNNLVLSPGDHSDFGRINRF